jgi:CubicO group peptidase (beta-lactamase class C family)
MKHPFLLAALLAFPAAATTVHAKAPFVDPASDPDHFGPPGKFLFWTPEQQVAGYRNIDKIFPTRAVVADGTALELPEALVDLDDVPVRTEDSSMTVDEYFQRQNVAGLLVLKDGKIAYERYGLGNSRESRWISFSVTKSVVSMLVGAAIRDGYIESVDEMVSDYLPRLKGSPYAIPLPT